MLHHLFYPIQVSEINLRHDPIRLLFPSDLPEKVYPIQAEKFISDESVVHSRVRTAVFEDAKVFEKSRKDLLSASVEEIREKLESLLGGECSANGNRTRI